MIQPRASARRFKRSVKKVLTRRAMRRRVPTGKQHEWSIGIYGGDSPVSLRPLPGVSNPVLTLEDVVDVPARGVADPFMIEVAGRWHMFFEVINSRTRKGEIGLATSRNARKWTYRKIVLAEPFHLSYPYVFEWQGSYYMIPESHRDRSIRLYVASRFPEEWSFVGTLLTGQVFADASVFRWDGRWWLFALTDPDYKHDILRLYYADELTGPWHEHPSSPVIEGDPRVARPAGRVIVVDGRIIRYAQDCASHYGVKVRAFEIVQLTTDAYEERPIGPEPMLAPGGTGWNASGMHHVDPHPSTGGKWIACVDGWIGV